MASRGIRISFFCLSLSLAFFSFGVGDIAWGVSCRVFPFPMHFGAYDPFSPAPLKSIGSISIKCDESGIGFRIRLDSGQNAVGFQPRRLKSVAGGVLDYNLFRDTAHTEIWGDGTSSTVVQDGVLNKTVKKPKFTVFGLIPAGQNVTPDIYTDSVLVTLEF